MIALGYVQLLLQSGAIIFVHDSAGKVIGISAIWCKFTCGYSDSGDIWRYLAIFGDLWRSLEIFGDIGDDMDRVC